MNCEFPTDDVHGAPVERVPAVEALAEIERRYREEVPALVNYVEAHSLNLASRDAEHDRLLRE